MKIRVWNPTYTSAEEADLAYWERNVLALHFADTAAGDGWYNDDVPVEGPQSRGLWKPRFDGWRRVISLQNGSITFHVPDDFEVGNLPEIERNWDGHTTEQKWARLLKYRGIAV